MAGVGGWCGGGARGGRRWSASLVKERGEGGGEGREGQRTHSYSGVDWRNIENSGIVKKLETEKQREDRKQQSKVR